MRIASVVDSLSTFAGGMQVTVSQFSKELITVGHEVVLIGGHDDGEIDYSDNVQKLVLNRIGSKKYSFLKNLEQQLDRFQPNIVIQHGIWSLFCIQITRYCKRNKIPYVVVPHGMLDPYILNQRPILKKIALLCYQNSNLKNSLFVRVLNENEKKHVALACPDVNSMVAPNGLNWTDSLNDVVRNRNIILFLGRIDQKKSVVELIKSWNMLKSRSEIPSQAQLRIVGWGDKKYEAKVIQLIQESIGIEFIGPKYGKDKEFEFKQAGAFILPSKGEGLPTAVLEAWSAGTIVIMSPECNFDLEVFGREALITGSSIDSICKSIEGYFRMSESETNSMRKLGSDYAKKYSWRSIVDRFSEILISKLK